MCQFEMSQRNESEPRQGLYHLKGIICPTQIKGLSDDVTRFNQHESAEHALGVLNNAFRQILRREHVYLNFEELYRNVYYLVLYKYGVLLYSNLQNVISQHLQESVLPCVQASINKNFLHVLNRCWENHHSSMEIIRDTLMYLDRVCTKTLELNDVYSMGLDSFRNQIVYNEIVQTTLKDTLLRLVMVERRGELIDRSSVKCVTKMLMLLGNGNDDVYKSNFEDPFLEHSALFFREMSKRFLDERNTSLYLRNVNTLIDREIERSNQCFDENTTPRLTKLSENELITAQMNVIIEMGDSGVVYMIEHQMTENLAQMYNLLGRVQGGLNAMFNCISNDLRGQGLKLNEEEIINGNVLKYVQNLLDLKEKYDFFLINSFSNDKNFKKVIASDFECILNLNPRSPEYLSLFFDDKLKKTARGMTEEESDVLFNKAIVLFRCLQDKDLFRQHYKQHLAKRLLTGKGLNEDCEMEVISKFKNECGSHYTRKMEGMFRDMSSSYTLTEEFHHYLNDLGDPTQGVDMSLRVLTASYWPTQKVLPPCNLPSSVLAAFETFQNFYLRRHCGRRLTLLPQLGSAELETNFVQTCEDGEGWHSAQTQPCGESRSYVLQVSTFQMCVLMAFNARPHWTFSELQMETNIHSKDLQKALQSLVMGKPTQKVLLKQPDSSSVDVKDAFYVNAAFSSRSNKVKILSYQAKNEMYSQKQESAKLVTAGQIFEVEAAIIRILKAKIVMNHDKLVNEVIESLRLRFVPTKDFVKTRIETLIEREYVARHPDDRRVYEYVP